LRDREIVRLREELAQAKPRKRRKVQLESNERFASLAQVLAQANREPKQRYRQTAKKVVVDENEDSSESENEQVPARRSTRNRQPTERYKHRDLDNDEESD
jgi:hypothetical protein